MSNEKTTKEITLEKSGATVVLFDYITGRDRRSIESVYFDQARITQKAGADKKSEVEINGVSGSVSHLMQDATIKVVVKEIKLADGAVINDKKKVLDFILDLHEAEYDLVIKQINEVTDPKKA